MFREGHRTMAISAMDDQGNSLQLPGLIAEGFIEEVIDGRYFYSIDRT